MIGDLMSQSVPQHSRTDRFLSTIISLPFLLLIKTGKFAHKKFMSRKDPKKIKPVSNGTPINLVPVVTDIPEIQIADRTHSQMYGSVKVCFYQYSKQKYIKIVARKAGVTKELKFTPAIAEQKGILYCMESAIAWTRQEGFVEAKAPAVSSSPKLEKSKKLVEATESSSQSNSTSSSTNQVKVDPLPLTSTAKSKPFRGRIIHMGEITRPKIGDKPPYQIYAIRLAAEYGGVEKEFSGEHLLELAEKYDLNINQVVSIQLLGRRSFNVEVNGVIEPRTRNEFSVVKH